MASYLRRNDDLRRLRTRILVLQAENGAYPAANSILRFVDANGVVGDSGVFIDNSGNLSVSGSADVLGGFAVAGSADISGNLTVGGSVDVSGNVNIDSNLLVAGTADVSGDLNVDGSVDVSGNLTVGNDVVIGGTLTITEDLIINGGLDISGDLGVSGNVDISGDLTVGSADASSNLIVYGYVSASGDVISHSGRSVLSVNSGTDVGVCKIYSVQNGTVGPQFQAYKSHDISGYVENGDELGRLNFFGMTQSGTYSFAEVGIRAFAAGDFTTTSHPAELRLATCPSGGIAAVDRLTVHSHGASQFTHNSATAAENYVERQLQDPCSGKVLYTRDYLVGADYTDGFSGTGPFRDYRYIYGPTLPGGNLPVWGIINDVSGGSAGDGAAGDIEFYNNVAVGAESRIDTNSAITIGGPKGRSLHRVFQDGSYNSLITHVASGAGNVGYRIDSQFYNSGTSLKYGSDLLLQTDTGVDGGITGNVGIGTANPQAKLDVSGTINVSQNITFNAGPMGIYASGTTTLSTQIGTSSLAFVTIGCPGMTSNGAVLTSYSYSVSDSVITPIIPLFVKCGDPAVGQFTIFGDWIAPPNPQAKVTYMVIKLA